MTIRGRYAQGDRCRYLRAKPGAANLLRADHLAVENSTASSNGGYSHMCDTIFQRPSFRCVISALAAFALLLCFAGRASAQRTTASVAGSIVDASESAVPGASVVVRNLATGVERTVESNDLGYYVVPALPAGPYSVTVTKTGFQTQTVPQLVLEVDQNATINISLKVGAISETVTVSAETAERRHPHRHPQYRHQPEAD